MDRNGLGILSSPECLRLLSTQCVGRVGLTRHALPAVHPVIYGLVGSDVVFATGFGSDRLAPPTDTVIAFEVDDIDCDTRTGWSVLVVGVGRHAAIRRGQPGSSAPSDLWPWTGDRVANLVRLDTQHVSGRRLSAETAVATR